MMMPIFIEFEGWKVDRLRPFNLLTFQPVNRISSPGLLVLPQYDLKRRDIWGLDALVQRRGQDAGEMLNGWVQPGKLGFVVQHLLSVVVHDLVEILLNLNNIAQIAVLIELAAREL